MDSLGGYMFVIFALHLMIVTKSCGTTDEYRQLYMEALPWGCECACEEGG